MSDDHNETVRIVAQQSGRTEDEVRAILDGYNSLMRAGEPEFRPIMHMSGRGFHEAYYESDDGVGLTIFTPVRRNGEPGRGEYTYFLKSEGSRAKACSSWREAIARRTPVTKQPERPPRGIHPKLVVMAQDPTP